MSDELTSQLINSAEVAVAQINAAAVAGLFVGLEFKAKRSYAAWTEELKEANGLQVDCVPSRYERTDLLSRERIGYQPSVEIYVREKFGTNDLDQGNKVRQAIVDRLVIFVEQLDVMFKTNKRPRLAPDELITWNSSTILVACSRPHLKDKQQFFGALKVIFDAPKLITPVET